MNPGESTNINPELGLENLLSVEEDWVYRFRPFNALSLKELLYDELFFATLQELNDPLDTLVNLIVSKGEDYVHEFFLKGAVDSIFPLRGQKQEEGKDFARRIAHVLAMDSIELRNSCYVIEKQSMRDVFVGSGLPSFAFDHFFERWKQILLNVYPASLRTVSFSEKWNNPMMWANYASAHRGYCLCFHPHDAVLRLRSHFSNVYKDFSLSRVEYNHDVSVPVSLMFDENSHEFSWQRLDEQFWPIYSKKTLLTKNLTFRNEEELRLSDHLSVSYGIDLPGSSAEDKQDLPIDRLFHYDPDQFAGVIFGFAMDERNKKEIRKVLESKSGRFRTFECIPAGNSLQIVKGSVHYSVPRTT